MKTQIPIYRAKKIDSDEYVEFEGKVTYGERMFAVSSMFMTNDVLHLDYRQEICPSTLAIHFPDWVCTDAETDEEVKVFASLDATNKKGGSELEIRDNFQGACGTLYFNSSCLMFQEMELKQDMLKAFQVTGIQQ